MSPDPTYVVHREQGYPLLQSTNRHLFGLHLDAILAWATTTKELFLTLILLVQNHK